ncbi:DUF2252 domain-containing protein [Nocardioides sp. Soil805]|uniref:DUF2252 domain-containing protein n=1 Tax=Nocardioides sp. Soil805 TaxID=1736416 RepID=UPI000702815B|nr:DUF2252 domain-containing protein [Nocardioides sp. Soil805]KRF34466.1 hypothetical protein ASG94_15540 [Nocardioides sp. Soil805]
MATPIEHPTRAQRETLGEEARVRTPLAAHVGWAPRPHRSDPVALIEEQNARRDADLVPVRHGRMMVSPFTFYRGAAKIMADDLSGTPTAGLTVQLCGDAHLSNFGVYASPERTMVFDINDFDETLPGPFEFDVKRLAASLTVAARHNGCTPDEARDVTVACVRAYREAMRHFAQLGTLDIWYAHLTEDDLREMMRRAITEPAAGNGKKGVGKKDKKGAKGEGEDVPVAAVGAMSAKDAKKLEKRFEKNAEKARSRTSMQALAKLTEVVDGRHRIVSVPPVIVPGRELDATYGIDPALMEDVILSQFKSYRSSLQHDRRHLLEQFEVVDWARKVVGVGSVGTRAFIALLQGVDETDPLFLQVKEATTSVLEGPLRKSRFAQPGQRVVHGQRLMQGTSDIFLGWTRGQEEGRFFYWRQLRDMKGSALVDQMSTRTLEFYGRLCGWTLARAHARSGDPIAIAAYLGADDTFELAITDFSQRYADQNERDHAAFLEAVRTSRIEAVEGV